MIQFLSWFNFKSQFIVKNIRNRLFFKSWFIAWIDSHLNHDSIFELISNEPKLAVVFAPCTLSRLTIRACLHPCTLSRLTIWACLLLSSDLSIGHHKEGYICSPASIYILNHDLNLELLTERFKIESWFKLWIILQAIL